MTSPTSLGMGAVLTVAIAVWAMLSFNEYLPWWGTALVGLAVCVLMPLAVIALTRGTATKTLAPFAPPGATLAAWTTPDGALHYSGADRTVDVAPFAAAALRTRGELLSDDEAAAFAARITQAQAPGAPRPPLPPVPAPGPVYQVALSAAEVGRLKSATWASFIADPALLLMIIATPLMLLAAIYQPFLALPALLSVYLLLVHINQSWRVFARLIGTQQRVTCGPDALHNDTAMTSTAIPYASITLVKQLPGGVVLLKHGPTRLLLLDELCPPAERDRFRNTPRAVGR